jgi:hypothetical protein
VAAGVEERDRRSARFLSGKVRIRRVLVRADAVVNPPTNVESKPCPPANRAKKLLPLVLIAGGVAVAARKLGSQMETSMNWAQMIERMPDDAPPKWMFNNITAIREEHERIVRQNEQILEQLGRLSEEHIQLPEPREEHGGRD